MIRRIVLLVEDNPDDIDLTLHCFDENRVINPVVVVKDGSQALDYLFCRGAYRTRAELEVPMLILLDLKLPKVTFQHSGIRSLEFT